MPARTQRPDVTETLAWAHRNPSSYVAASLDREKAWIEWIHIEFKPTVIVAEHVLDVLALSARDMTWATRSGQHMAMYAQALLLSQAVADLYGSHHMAIRGMCDQAQVVGRTAVEAGLRVLFLLRHPDAWEGVFMTASDRRAVGGDPRGHREFNATHLVRDELAQPEIWKWFFERPSKYVHANRMMATSKLGSVLKGDFSGYTPEAGPPPSMTDADWYAGFTNFYVNTLYFHVLLHEQVLHPHLRPEAAELLSATKAGLRKWCAEEGNAHAGLVGNWDALVNSARVVTETAPLPT